MFKDEDTVNRLEAKLDHLTYFLINMENINCLYHFRMITIIKGEYQLFLPKETRDNT
jgi:hypothetical protein